VFTEVVSMVTSTEAVLAALSKVTVPVVLSNFDNCTDKPMCWYEKLGKEWPLSTA